MNILIKKPCHENWNAMTPNEQGAFCGKCVKTVIDFSSKSVVEIKEFFISKQEEKVCGRFEKSQLIALSFDGFFNEFKGFNLTKRFAVIVYFTFGITLFNTSSLNAQTNPQIKGDVEVIHAMGGVRAIVPKDTVKPCKKPELNNMIMGKVIAPQALPEEKLEIGEVSVVDPKLKVSSKPKKPIPKKK